MPVKFSKAGDFLKALNENSLVEPLVREGVAKSDATNAQLFLFSESTSRGPWIRVPVEVIESVEFLRTVNCGDHEHPFVRLQLKEPPTADVASHCFAKLARRSTNLSLSPFTSTSASNPMAITLPSAPISTGIVVPVTSSLKSSELLVSSFSFTIPQVNFNGGFIRSETVAIFQNGNYSGQASAVSQTGFPCYCSFSRTISLLDANQSPIVVWSWAIPTDGTVLGPNQDSGPVKISGNLPEIQSRYFDIKYFLPTSAIHKSGVCIG